jgi:hypothetical protein
MLRKKCMTMAFLILIALSNLVDAYDVEYIVSFVAGRTNLGLVFVTRTDTAIEVGQPSFTPIGKNLGSTAVLAQMGYWMFYLGLIFVIFEP